MKTLSLAARNLLRNRRRSLATLLALALGAAAVLLFGGYSADIRYSMLTSYVQAGGHLQVQQKDFHLYGNGNPVAYGIVDYERIVEAIRSDEQLSALVKVVSPTLQFGGLAGNYDAGVSRTVVGIGYVAEDVKAMREWNEYRLPPMALPYLLVGAREDDALVGIGVARVLQLCEPLSVPDCGRPASDTKPAGGPKLAADIAALVDAEQPRGAAASSAGGRARIEVLASQPRGSPNVASVNVVAAENQGFKELDEVTVILQFTQAQKLVYSKGKPRATSIMVQLHETESMPLAAARIQALIERTLPGQSLAVLDFELLNPFYTQTLQLFDTIFGFIFVLIGGIVLFTVGNTMTAAVVERTNEIGTIRAVGLRRRGVQVLFATEGLLLGCTGALVGVLSALLISAVVNVSNMTWLPPGSSTALPLTVRVWGEPRMIVGTTLGLVAIAAVSAWLPAWRAAKLKIVDALRHT